MGDVRLARSLQMLVHIHRRRVPVSSEELGEQFAMNPVVVRRTLSPLRDAGIVSSAGGRHGGWQLGRQAQKITALEVHRALRGELFAIGTAESQADGAIETLVNEHLSDAMREAAKAFEAKLSGVTVATLALRSLFAAARKG